MSPYGRFGGGEHFSIRLGHETNLRKVKRRSMALSPVIAVRSTHGLWAHGYCNFRKQNQVYLWLVGGGKQAFDEGLPFGVERGAAKFPGALIPIFGVGGLAPFAVHVGVNRHAICGF